MKYLLCFALIAKGILTLGTGQHLSLSLSLNDSSLLYTLRCLKILYLTSFDCSFPAIIVYEETFALKIKNAILVFVGFFFLFEYKIVCLLYTVQITQQSLLRYQYVNTITCVV